MASSPVRHSQRFSRVIRLSRRRADPGVLRNQAQACLDRPDRDGIAGHISNRHTRRSIRVCLPCLSLPPAGILFWLASMKAYRHSQSYVEKKVMNSLILDSCGRHSRKQRVHDITQSQCLRLQERNLKLQILQI